MKVRVNELARALEVDTAEIIAICTILNLPATSKISSLTIEQCKKITDYFEVNSRNHKS